MSQKGSRPLVIKGKLQDLHPAKLYYSFFKAGKTGVMTFHASGQPLRVFLHRGVPVCPVQELESDPDVLSFIVDEGRIAREEMRSLLSWADEEKISGAQALIRRGVLTPAEWQDLAGRRYWQRARESFAWRQGEYVFRDEGYTPPAGVPETKAFARFVLMGIREHYNAAPIQKRFVKRMNQKLVPHRKGPLKLETLDLTADEQRLYAIAHSGRPVREILESPGVPLHEAAKILYGLLLLELFKFEKTEAQKPAATSGSAGRPVERKSVLPAAKPFDNDEGTNAAGDPRLAKLFDEAVKSAEKYQVTQSKKGVSDEDLIAKQLESDSSPFADITAAPARKKKPAPPAVEEEPSPPPPPAEPEPDAYELGALEPGHTALGLMVDPQTEGADFRVDAIEYKTGVALGRLVDLAFSPDDDGETVFKIGLTYLDDEDYARARNAFEEAIRRGYEFPEVLAYLGWAIYRDPGETDPVAASKQPLDKAIEMNKDYFFPYIIRGRIARDERDYRMAELWFVKAQELNKDDLEAKEEIRRLHAR